MTVAKRWVPALLLFLGMVPGAAWAQDARLVRRLDPATLERVHREITLAGEDGLPVEPLVQKALEGQSRRAPPERIVAAVRGLRERLGTARSAMGAGATETELVAGAAALYLDVEPALLTRMKEDAPGASVTLPLVVLADLIQRGVPTDTASGVVLRLNEARVDEETFHSFRFGVERDIEAGTPPGVAATSRSRTILGGGPGSIPPESRD